MLTPKDNQRRLSTVVHLRYVLATTQPLQPASQDHSRERRACRPTKGCTVAYTPVPTLTHTCRPRVTSKTKTQPIPSPAHGFDQGRHGTLGCFCALSGKHPLMPTPNGTCLPTYGKTARACSRSTFQNTRLLMLAIFQHSECSLLTAKQHYG